MSRALPQRSEVTRSSHKSGTKMMLPDSIHEHSNGERILRIHDRGRQFFTTAAFRITCRLSSREDSQKTTRSHVTGLQQIAAESDFHVVVTGFVQGMSGLQSRRSILLQLSQLGFPLVQLCLFFGSRFFRSGLFSGGILLIPRPLRERLDSPAQLLDRMLVIAESPDDIHCCQRQIVGR